MASQNSLSRQQQQHMHRSNRFLTKTKSPPSLHATPSEHSVSKGRKRRASEDEDMANAGASERSRDPLHTVKRNRAGTQKQFPIGKLLATLEKEKLIEIINDLVDHNPQLQPKVDAHIPSPSTQSVSLIIGSLEKTLSESFPYNRTQNRDDYCFNRVKPALIHVVDALIEYAEHFTSSPHEHPSTLFSYLHYATCVTHRLPTWDNDAHNQIKRDLYAGLISYWLKTIDLAASTLAQGKIYGQQVVTEWAENLAQHEAETHGLFTKVIEQFVQRFGWLIGVEDASSLLNSTRTAHVRFDTSSGSSPHHVHPSSSAQKW